MEDRVSVVGLSKPDVLAALYNASNPQGRGLLHFDPCPMTRDEAETLLREVGSRRFDYVKGRVLKLDFSDGATLGWRWLDVFLYDRDNGPGAAARAVEKLWDELTRPDAEIACCPACAGKGVMSKQDAEQWADARRAEAWRQKGVVPDADAEVDESRFRQVEIGVTSPVPAQESSGVDWGVESAQTFCIPIVAPIESPPPVELSQRAAKLPESAVDADRFRVVMSNQRPAAVWEVLVGGRAAWPRVGYSSRKEALAAANRLRRTEQRGVSVERVDGDVNVRNCKRCVKVNCGFTPPKGSDCLAFESRFFGVAVTEEDGT